MRVRSGSLHDKRLANLFFKVLCICSYGLPLEHVPSTTLHNKSNAEAALTVPIAAESRKFTEK